jgi:hypothetical protein
LFGTADRYKSVTGAMGYLVGVLVGLCFMMALSSADASVNQQVPFSTPSPVVFGPHLPEFYPPTQKQQDHRHFLALLPSRPLDSSSSSSHRQAAILKTCFALQTSMQGDGERGLRETFALMGDSSPATAQDAEATLRSGVKDLVDRICTPLMSAQRKAPTAPAANTTCTLLEMPAPLEAAAAAAAAQAAAAAANTTCSFDELPPALIASRAAAAAAAKAAQAAAAAQAAKVPQAAAAAGNSTCTLDELPPVIAASRAAAAAAAASAPCYKCNCGDKPSKLWVHVLANGVAPAEEAV